MTDRDRKMVVVARLRAAPLVGWQFACAVLLGVLAARLEWGGDPIDALRYMIFAQPLLLLGIAAVLTVWAYVKIGRASCRERVCQYVSLSVVAVSLKTNHTNQLYIDSTINITIKN